MTTNNSSNIRNLLDRLTDLLNSDDRLVSEGKLLKNKVTELALNLDASLLKLLLSDTAIKAHFFTEVGTVLVFDKIKFQKFVNNKQFLPDSYTAYKNKIGLTANDQYLTDSKEVVLSFPYKDCILEGGQDKEDAKREEIFWNETLAPDQIDRLLSPKLLTHFKRFDKDGEHAVTKINPSDNLIIKGNNLLALHTLESQFAGKVKLIYIDPPFNTENDSFRYNDKFSHSTWLTFMTNRLSIAKKLLKSNGAIFIHLDHEEAPYCKILLDEIFGRENWLNTFSVTTNDASGFKATGKAIFSTANQIMFYAKNKNLLTLKKQFVRNEYDTNYNQVLLNKDENIKNWQFEPISKIVATKLGFDSPRVAKKELGDLFNNEIADFAFQNANNVFRTAAINGGARAKRIKTIEKSMLNKNEVFLHPNDDQPNFYILNGEGIVFYGNRLVEIDGETVAGQLLTDIWTDIKVTGIANEGGVSLKNGKKPEKLLKRILEIATEKNDLVLDFHLGSGTTAAVAHKMQRQYIGIEQMDYIETIAINRLKNVINRDSTGISKAMNWQGGGSFVYCELAKANQTFVDVITQAATTEELSAIWQDMKDRAFISYKVDVKQIDATKVDFAELSLDDHKRFLIATLDQNMLYIPLSEMDDATFGVSDADKALNKQFFKLGDV